MANLYWENNVLSCTRDALQLDGRPVTVTAMERRLLLFFMEHPNQTLTREELLREVWGYETAGITRTVDTHIKNLRAHLGKWGSLISTVRGTGYRLDASPSQVCICFCPEFAVS